MRTRAIHRTLSPEELDEQAMAIEPSSWKNPVQRLRVRLVMNPEDGFISEIIRLMILDPCEDLIWKKLEVDKSLVVAHRCGEISTLGGTLFVAEQGNKTIGVLFLVPKLWESAVFGKYIWRIERLLLAPDAPAGTIEALLDQASNSLGSKIDFLSVRVPDSYEQVVGGLLRRKFQVVAKEVEGVYVGQEPLAWQIPGISFGPLEASHLEPAADIINRCGTCHSYFHDQQFDRKKVRTFFQGLLMGHIHKSDRGTIAVLERDTGLLLGVVGFTSGNDFGENAPRHVDHLDFLCIHPKAQNTGLCELLQRQALRFLTCRPGHVVMARTFMKCDGSVERLEAMRRIGFDFTSINLILHCWLNDDQMSLSA